VTDRRAPTVAEDVETRRLAQCEFTRPIVVEAGAGTGKTALLVARVVAWCVGPGWTLHEDRQLTPEAVARKVVEGVVAVTFTEAAAAEMARKIGEALTALALGSEPIGWMPDPGSTPDADEVERRAAYLSDEVHRLSVGTIHSFCQSLLSSHPLEAGLHPRFTVDAEEEAVAALVVEVVEEALRTLEQSPQRPEWEVIAAAGVDPPQIAVTLQYLVSNGIRSIDLETDPFTEDRALREATDLREALSEWVERVGDRLDNLSASATQSIRARDTLEELAVGLEGMGSPPSWSGLEALFGGVRPATLKRISEWGTGAFNSTETKCLGDSFNGAAAAMARLAPILGRLAPLRPVEFTAGRRVLAPLLAEVERRKTARGLVGFNDLLFRASALVENSSSVVRELCAQIDQLLVDEFQDTDAVQCRLVEAIAFSGGAAPGLFVVGDPKQSIYAWRNADLAAYSRFVATVRDHGGERHPLVQNFRSVEPILDEVSEVVGEVMIEADDVQPPFVPLIATEGLAGASGFASGTRSAVERWVAWPRGDDGEPPAPAKSGVTSSFEAEMVAADIRDVASRHGVRWGDFAVLLRATTAQEELLEAFRRHGIPYEVAREKEFYRQREVVEAAALIRTIVDPTDTLALLTVLRSDVVGVPDAALAPLWDSGFANLMSRLEGPGQAAHTLIGECVANAVSAVPPNVPARGTLRRWPVALTAAVGVIAELRASFAADPPDRFVERVRTSWLAEVSAAARFLGRFRRVRLERFFTDLEDRLAAGEGGVSGLSRFLRQSVADGQKSAVGGEPDLQADAVHVMTIHGAKGLDFRHVYLVQVHRQTGGGEKRGPDPRVLPLAGRREYRIFGWPTPDFGEAADLKDRQSSAEMVRLLYVAMTRAKERLVISGGWNAKPVTTTPLDARSFADLLDHRLDRGALGDQIESSEVRRVDGDRHSQWYVPALEGEPPAGERAEKMPDLGLVDLEGVRRQAAFLSAARESAAGRMARPLTGGASSLEETADVRHDREEGAASRPLGYANVVGTAVGTAVHRMMEDLDLEDDLGPQISSWLESAAAELEATLEGRALADAVNRLRTVIEGITEGNCLATLRSLAASVAGREIAIVASPLEDRGPIGAVTGFVDLIYRDPGDGRLVVADYKTDHLDGEEAIAERSGVYEPQVRTYASALRDALHLDYEPRAELWFLAADRIVRL